MRDIKPMQKPPNVPGNIPEPKLPSPKQLYSKPEKPRFTGSNVPVAATPVPPVPPKESAADLYRAGSPKKSARVGDKERKLIAILLVLVVVVLGLAAFLFLPKAEIVLTLQTAPLLLDQELKLQAAAAEAGTIPGTVYEREVTVQAESAVTSRQVIGTKATGTARIVNRTVDEQKIREQSRLVTESGTLFYMQKHAIVPPNSAVSVPIEAAEAGEQGNITPQRLDFAALDESAQSLVFAEVDTALTGGSGSEVAIVKAEDIERARQDAAQAGRAQIEQEIRSELQNGWILLEESWAGELKSFETAVKENDQKDVIPYTANVTLHVLAYEERALQQALQQALESRLDADHMLFPEPISFTKTVQDVNWEAGEATILVRATHTTIPAFSLETLQEKLAGRSEEEAKTYLEGLPGVKSSSLELSPFWARTIPRIEKRISIELIPDRQP